MIVQALPCMVETPPPAAAVLSIQCHQLVESLSLPLPLSEE